MRSMSLVVDLIDLVTKHKSGELRCPGTALILMIISIQGHLRVGKALKGLGEMDYALRAFINCYRDLDRNEAESIKIEVMTELTGVSGCIPRNRCKSIKKKKKKKKKM